MRILYIAFDNPATENIISGMNDETLAGLPALYYPFKKLLERGHTVDLLLFSSDAHKTLVESEHFKNDNFFHVALTNDEGIKGKISFIRTIRKETKKLIRTRQYDFVYGLGEGAILGVEVARKAGIHCGYRQFGVYNDFEKEMRRRKTLIGKSISAFLHHTYAYIPMRTKTDFLLMTNDGSHPDVLYDMLKIRKKYKYFFWRSGINMPENYPAPSVHKDKAYPDTFDKNAMVQISRFAPEKRQPRSATILGILHKRGYKMHLYYVGDYSCTDVKNAVLDEARKWNVQDYVHIEGRRKQARAWEYSRNALACIISNESGLGNVFYENMAQGSMVVAAKASTLDEYVENGVNGFQFATEEEAADQIEKMLNDETAYWDLRKRAYDTAQARFLSIEKRFGMEADLIEDAAYGKSLDAYPENL